MDQNTEQKMMTLVDKVFASIFLIAVSGVAIALIGTVFAFIRDRVTSPPSPPPGWEIVCDGNGYYAPKSGSYIMEDEASKNRHVAMNAAHRWDRLFKEISAERAKNPKPPRNWSVCEN